MSFSCSVYEIQTQIFFGLDHNMKKSMIITIYCVFGCQIASYEVNTPVYWNKSELRNYILNGCKMRGNVTLAFSHLLIIVIVY